MYINLYGLFDMSCTRVFQCVITAGLAKMFFCLFSGDGGMLLNSQWLTMSMA